MALPSKYDTEENVLANYNFFDIADGTGIVNFYGSQSIMSGLIVLAYLTSDGTQYSGKVVEKVKPPINATTKVSDINYDVTFNLPQRIKGQARLSVTQGTLASGGVNCQVFLITKLYHVNSAGAEDLMASADTQTTDEADSGGTQASVTRNLNYDLSSQIWSFKAGDKLRLNIECWGISGNNANNVVGYGIDPQDRDDSVTPDGTICISASDTTQMKLAIPFILDL